MTLPSSGQIAASDINVELGRAWNHFFDMNAAAERNLAGKPTGSIGFADFYGKSNLIREPASGEFPSDSTYNWRVFTFNKRFVIRWDGVDIYQSDMQDFSTTYVLGTWTYYKGAFNHNSLGTDMHNIYRIGKY